MDFKTCWKNSILAFIIKNVIAAIAVLLVITWIALWGVNRYTQHGKTESVPDLRGLYVEEAEALLSKMNLYPSIIDSMYMSDKPLGSILEQTPLPRSTVKRQRPVYLIVNSRQIRQVPLPDVNDMSFRQAEAMLKSIGLKVGSVQYAPSEYKNMVLSVVRNGTAINPGTRLPEGTPVTLVVGHGIGGEQQSAVPPLKGLALESARRNVMLSSFVIGAVEYDVLPSGNEPEYVIYRQRPKEGSCLPKGSRIDVWLSKDPAMLEKEFDDKAKNTHPEDEEFF